jgi:hypothetical protein
VSRTGSSTGESHLSTSVAGPQRAVSGYWPRCPGPSLSPHGNAEVSEDRCRPGSRSVRELAPEVFGEAYGGLDFDLADRHRLDVDAEREPEAPAEGHQFECGRLGMFERGVQGVLGVAQLVLDPARDIEPSQRRNSIVFIEPQTEKVKTIGTGCSPRASHSYR